MKSWNSHHPLDGRIRTWASLFVVAIVSSGIASAEERPAPATGDPPRSRFAPGSEVVLKVPELPIFDQQGQALSCEDHLTFTVEQSESGRLLLGSRDKSIRGWAYDDEVVALEQATDYFDQVVVFDKFNLDAYWVLGRLWFYKNDDTRALVELNRAIGGIRSDRAGLLSEPYPGSAEDEAGQAGPGRLREVDPPRTRLLAVPFRA